jgi:hypothetical protein
MPACPAKGGPTWTELRSPHFILRTDRDPDDGEELARTLEELRATILAVAWPNAADPPGRITTVAFRSENELTVLLPDGALGEWRRYPPFAPTLLVGSVDRRIGLNPIAHEVTHDLAHRFLPLEPPWFSEGIATYFETIVYDRAAGEVRVGLANAGRYAELERGWKRFSEPVVHSHTVPPGAAGWVFEGRSWLLFHLLADHHPAELARFQELMRQLTPSDRAWQQAFPNLSFSQLDDEIEDCMRRECLRGSVHKLRVVVGAIDRRPMRDAEVHALRAYLFATEPMTRPRAAPEIDEALAQEPASVEALAADFYFRGATPEAKRSLARRAAEGSPGAWLTAVMLADAMGPRDPVALASLLRALPAAPAEPELLHRLARTEADAQRWEQAVALSERVIRLGNPSLDVLSIYGAGLARTGRCDEAEFVVDAVASLALPVDARRLSRLHTDVEATCQASKTARLPQAH